MLQVDQYFAYERSLDIKASEMPRGTGVGCSSVITLEIHAPGLSFPL